MSKADRVMRILETMTDEERGELFDEIDETYCTGCGAELPDADSKEPDHDCPAEAEDDDLDEEGEDGLDSDETGEDSYEDAEVEGE